MAFDKSQMAYEALRGIIAERTNGVVFWVGSGPSLEANLPSWSGLKDELLRSLQEKIYQLDVGEGASLRKSAILTREDQNHWRAFDRLRTALGQTTWQSRIRQLLDPPATVGTPLAYQKIWRLRPHGVLTLNLDRLVSKAYAETCSGEGLLTEFVGRQVADYTHTLKNPHPFVCHLHGKLDDASSWILTSSALAQVQRDRAYTNFVRTCLTAKTVVFLGISTDDQAVGGLIEQLSELGIDVDSHYWITDRRDSSTDRWAERQGIRVIRYSSSDNDHSELLEMLDDLTAFVSTDDPKEISPVSPVGLVPANLPLPSKDDLLRFDEEQIRQILNNEASRILKVASPDAVDEYNEFSQDYDLAMYRAWYTSDEPGYNRLLGNTLHEERASGAFGKVYRATDTEGNEVAVKVLHEGIRRNSILLQAFRRGVRSMQILGHNHVDGMVPYRKTFEIPACVVMDWVDGPNLDEAVSSKQIRDWELVLRIGSEIADIVRRGHVLPERVLHRDLRPSNVMLRGYYSDPHEWDVVVLDFDLSWHRGALEKSVVYGSNTFGYLAPEQIQDIQGVSTRHATVDSFGIGMVLFFMMSGRDPVPDEHKHIEWKNVLSQATRRLPPGSWHSLPSRFARLIECATQDRQAERWDMTQIQAELERLHKVMLFPQSIESSELIAEEIAARCEFSKDYEWDSDTLSAVRSAHSGVRIEVRGDESQRDILVKLSWGEPGVQGRAYLDKWIPNRMQTARELLVRGGWRIEESGTKYAYISIFASLSVEVALEDMNQVVKSLDRALEQLRF